MMNVDQVLKLLQDVPLSDALDHYAYGTAGFRYNYEWMDGIFVRVGIVSAMLLGQEDMGCMITASHNDESYNGVKLSNPNGSMIDSQQESFLVKWVNERNLDIWKKHLLSLDTATTTSQGKATFHIGYDTRHHSERLAQLTIQGCHAMNCQVKNHGVLTTPMLHHIVLHSNPKYLQPYTTPCPTRAGYIQMMATAYTQILSTTTLPPPTSGNNHNSRPPLQVDGACGVGYQAVQDFCQATNLTRGEIQVWNAPGQGPLNVDCGSEHVQKQLQVPKFYNSGAPTDTSYCCSLDGDADRIVFFAANADNKLTLLDGDKISVLVAHYLTELLQKAHQQQPDLPKISMGVVQTAYANGASTDYLKSTLKIPVTITKTGVKHLHHAALEYDIGIYFEANGHGTVLFGPNYWDFCSQCSMEIFRQLPQLINPAVGDALSDLLLVDILLRSLHWSLEDWNTKLYTDLPSRQLKVQVKDRSMVVCNDNETKCVLPKHLQPLLDDTMARMPNGRCFVRASGTENVVRVYAEAKTRPMADQLATMTAELVHIHCQGLGPVPKI